MQRSPPGQFKPFNASAYKVGIVVADFNSDITAAMLRRAQATLARYRVLKRHTHVYHVPGCIEISPVLHALATKRLHALVAIGCIIQGQTDHYQWVADMVCRGVQEVQEEGVPVGFGILTVRNKKQALARLESADSAVVAALHSAKILREIKNKRKF